MMATADNKNQVPAVVNCCQVVMVAADDRNRVIGINKDYINRLAVTADARNRLTAAADSKNRVATVADCKYRISADSKNRVIVFASIRN